MSAVTIADALMSAAATKSLLSCPTLCDPIDALEGRFLTTEPPGKSPRIYFIESNLGLIG